MAIACTLFEVYYLLSVDIFIQKKKKTCWTNILRAHYLSFYISNMRTWYIWGKSLSERISRAMKQRFRLNGRVLDLHCHCGRIFYLCREKLYLWFFKIWESHGSYLFSFDTNTQSFWTLFFLLKQIFFNKRIIRCASFWKEIKTNQDVETL